MTHDCSGNECICRDESRMMAMLDIALSGLAKRGQVEAPILTDSELHERVHVALPYLQPDDDTMSEDLDIPGSQESADVQNPRMWYEMHDHGHGYGAHQHHPDNDGHGSHEGVRLVPRPVPGEP